jgi:hypothetical protein
MGGCSKFSARVGIEESKWYKKNQALTEEMECGVCGRCTIDYYDDMTSLPCLVHLTPWLFGKLVEALLFSTPGRCSIFSHLRERQNYFLSLG